MSFEPSGGGQAGTRRRLWWPLLRELVRRDIESRYAGSLLGAVWALVQPLWQLALFTFIFSMVLRIPVEGMDRPGSFALFLFAGLLPWTALQEGLTRSATAISDASSLLKRARFPAHLLVLGPVATALLHQAAAAMLFVLLLVGCGRAPGPEIAWLVPATLLQATVAVGLGLALATLHVFVRDLAQALPMLLGAWFYLTPIVYPVDLVPEQWRWAFDLNPMSAVVGWYRVALLGGHPPGGPAVSSSLAWAALALAAGTWLFRRGRPHFVDEI